MAVKKAQEVCCPVFDPMPWEGKTHVWNDKKFIKDSIRTFLHIPFPPLMARMVRRAWGKVQAAGAAPEMKDFLMLACDPSCWKSEFYFSVTRDVPNAENVTLSGTFVSRVFDGPYNSVPKWIAEMERYCRSRGQAAKRYYIYYTTCPKCAKRHGHNYVVVFAEVETGGR